MVLVKTMSLSIKSWSTAAFALGAIALAALGSAQTQVFPAQKGGPLRQGNNGAPNLDNSGWTNLTWFQPNGAAQATATEDTSSIDAFFTGTWLAPILADNTTSFFTYSGANTDTGINTLVPFLYSPVIPSAKNGNVLAGFGATPSVFTFAFNPNNHPLSNTANDYAIYVDIPAGPIVDAGGIYHYQPRYYCFEIDYATNQHYIDIVDTQVSGYGWVRLGNGGAATNVLFHYDGTNPINVNLFNTVPRNSSGYLQGVRTSPDGQTILSNSGVYANAAQLVPNIGSYISSPIQQTDTLGNTSVFAAVNNNVIVTHNGSTSTQTRGSLSSYVHNSGALNWTYSPADQGSIGVTMSLASAGVSVTAGWTNSLTTPLTGFAGFIGTHYEYETVTNVAANADVVTFAPTLADGTYDIKLWLPGPVNPAVAGYPVFAQNVQVEVDQGATVNTYTIDLTQTNGYVSVSPGNRFTHTQAAPLVVKISNYSAAGADAGKLAFANAVRFVGAENLAITSTPVSDTVNVKYSYFDNTTNTKVTTTALKTVTVICAEDGHIYCLDNIGRADGTTDIYWAYPSLPDPTNTSWTDPNNNSPLGTLPTSPDGSNGVTVAQMPTGFSLSSPLIVKDGANNGKLYVAANNGRIYCLDMTSRGDSYLPTRTPGTTTRLWTFPNDYRPDAPTTPSVPSALGATNASLLYNSQGAIGPTIYVPSAQGRMYALDAVGTPAQTTTTTRWAYPPVTSQTVGPFNSTPAIDGPAGGGQILFAGTERKNGRQAGQFFAFNADTGAVNWIFQNTTNSSVGTDDFESGPATAFNGLADGIAGSAYVFVANSNGYVYALDAATGATLWATNETGTTVSAPLMFTYMNVFANNFNPTATPVPILEVPDDAGNFWAMFACGNNASTFPTNNVRGGKLAGGYKADGDVLYAGTASGHQFMYGADNHGYLYGFSTAGGANGGINGPGSSGPIETANNPDSLSFTQSKIGFLTAATYKVLRNATVPPDYNTYTAASNFVNRTAFDFGETIYVIVYNYPSQDETSVGPPPVYRYPNVSFTFTSQGRTIRGQLVTTQKFAGAPTYQNPGTGITQTMDGYAVYAFPLQPNGAQMLAPGNGSVSTSFQMTNGTGGNIYMFGNPGAQTQPFTIANPLALAMALAGPGTNYGLTNDSLGADNASFADPANPQNAFNGSIGYAGLGFDPSRLYAGFTAVSRELATHGQTSDARTVYAYDRSLMELLNGPDAITTNGNNTGVAGSISVRVDRTNAAWNGGYNAIVKPLGGAKGLYLGGVPLLENWEDYPTQYPNTSLDYPDILAEFVTVSSFPSTIAGNPVFSPVTLPNPDGVLDANGAPLPNPQNRTPNPMPIDVRANVPHYQPANLATVPDINTGSVLYSGYDSSMDVFIDPNGSGKLSLNGNNRSAYRSFTYMLGVGIDQHISILTPTLDLGALPESAGLSPANGVTLPSVLNPWADLISTQHLYGSFQAVNDGNTNLRNVRLAKATNTVGGGYFGWPFYASANDDLSFMDGSLYMWSDLDAYQNGGAPIGFTPSLGSNGGPLTRGEVFVQKPRTTAVSGTRITPNPIEWLNGNTGNVGGTALNPAYPINQDPHIGITPPLGMPVGTYTGIIRLIEDNNYDLSLLFGNPNALEPFSDPTLSLSFTVRESRLTNSSSPFTHTMVDNLAPGGATNSLDSNIEPAGMRDRTLGNLFFIWSSNRTAANNGALANSDYAYRLYGSTLVGSQPAGTGSPLNELAKFSATNANQWFALQGPYPFGASSASSAAANAAFGATGTDHVIGTVVGEEDTVRFGQPALPNSGLLNPFVVGDATGVSDFGHAIMAFTGSATVQTGSGRFNSNRLFATTVTMGGSATVNPAVSLPGDPDLPKGKPSVAQVGPDSAVIFFSQGTGGRSRLYYALYNGGVFSQTVPIDTGTGFDSVTDPSAQPRLYQGVDAVDVAQTNHMIELAFSGHLRGRPNNEIFLARVPTDANGAPNASNSNQEMLSYFATRFKEQLVQEGAGVYRGVGAAWNPVQGDVNRSIDIGVTNGASPLNSIILPGTAQVFDQQSGILTLQTTMGIVYVDTFQGSIRFANSQPGPNYQVFATYQPKFLRLSVSKTAGLTGPTLLWDDRHVGSSNYNAGTFQMFDRYWYVGNAHANLSDARLLNNRFLVTYSRSAAGTGQSARPMMESIRLGVQLNVPTATGGGTVIPTLQNGDIDFGNFAVSSPNPYQVDPTTGRVYFTALDEDQVVTITVNGVAQTYKVGLIPELYETPIRIDQPINEGHATAFIDPFDSAGANTRRPDLFWLLWTSTRAGTSDVYFETISPVLWPVVK